MRSFRSRSAVVLIALVAALFAASAAPSMAGPPGESGPIVYTDGEGVHVVQADGSGADLVVAGSFNRPDVSSDGTAVLVVEAAPGESGPLVSIDLATGSKTTVVADPVRAGVWSPDGSRLTYATDGGIWVKEGNGAAVQVSEAHNDVFDWSPVDDRVIVSRSVPTESFVEYYLETLDVETGDIELVRDNGPGLFTWYIMDADFSPDGEDFVYSSVTPAVVEIAITGQEDDPIDPGGSAMGNPRGAVAWSPDGSAVVYTTYGSGFAEVLAVHKLASNATATFGSSASEVQWAPLPKEPPTDSGFEDVPDGNVFAADIAWLAEKGITRGCNPPDNTQFCPDDFVTRGQMAAFLVRAFGYTDDGGGDLFSDDDGSVFERDIDRLATAGVTRGCNPPDNTEYCPDDLVTRGQMAAFLVRAFGYTDDGGGDLFSDDDGSVFERDIDRLATAGVTRGCNPPDNTEYCPNENVTRAQMAAFLHRALGD